MKSLSLGTILEVENDDSTPTFVKIGNLDQIEIPSPEKTEVDVTDFDSQAEETLGSLPNNGTISMGGFLNGDDEGQDLMEGDAHDDDSPVRNCRITLTRQGKQYTFAGWIKSFKATAPGPKQAYRFTCMIRVSGAVNRGPIES